MRITHWTRLASDVRIQQRTAPFLALVRHQAGAVLVGELQGHRQTGDADRRAIVGELTLGALRTTGVERDGGEATSLGKVVVDVVSVVGGVPGAEARSTTEALLDRLHQR